MGHGGGGGQENPASNVDLSGIFGHFPGGLGSFHEREGYNHPPPHVFWVIGPHTRAFINDENSAFRKESVGVSWGSVEGWFGGSDFKSNLGQVHLFLPPKWPRNLQAGANRSETWIQHPQNRGTPCGHCWLATSWGRLGVKCFFLGGVGSVGCQLTPQPAPKRPQLTYNQHPTDA